MASDINRVILTGRLTADPELHSTGGGMAILKMRLAFNDRRKEGGEWVDGSNFVNVAMFGNRAESLSRFLEKGKQVAIDGKLRWSEWDDRNGGGKRSKLEVLADDIKLLDSKDDCTRPAYTPPIDDDEIPF